MPVIQLSLARLKQFCRNKVDEEKIFETLPYLGLDIEDRSEDVVSVEYSPNRPDFSSEVGIARSLVGILGLELGAPKYVFLPSKYRVSVVGDEIKSVRPFIHAIYAEITLTDELIKQLITMQEDLHNGIGRRRSKVAIGIHNAEVITNQIMYQATRDQNYSFPPLGSKERQTISQILTGIEQGISYGKLLSSGSYPILEDSHGSLLSMPPIINGDLTRLAAGQTKVFVDLTGTDDRVVDTSTAIIAAMLSDSGARVYSVEIHRPQGSVTTPNMTPKTMRFDLDLTKSIIGYDFTMRQAEHCLGRSRIGTYANGSVAIPRYRHDIIHPIDLVEEVALGFGIQLIKPQSVQTSLVGSFSGRQNRLDRMIEGLVGLGLTEIWNLSLTGADQVAAGALKVDDSKSQNYEYLRGDILRSLLTVLGNSTHQEYPQKIFEQAPVFKRSSSSILQVDEEEHAGVLIADSSANYSVIRSVVDAFLKLTLDGKDSVSYVASMDNSSLFASGRYAVISLRNEGGTAVIGLVGEISPATLERYGLKVPAVGFEINLETFLKE
ncbi:MAG: phenylalanine--tRNA ligase subunit beta [Nitrososphaerota archaeon]|nr:phenylalanine--tRNA ligase subunit beta [Nitrososphaerota archaeon]